MDHAPVQVAPAGGGYEIDNVSVTVDVAATPTSVRRQIAAFGDPNDGDAVAKVTNAPPGLVDHGVVVRQVVDLATPLPIREYHGGTTRFDTGLLLVPASIDFVTAEADVYVDVLLVANQAEVLSQVALADGAGLSYGSIVLQPNELHVKQMYGLRFSGGLQAATDGSIGIQVKGTL